MNRLLSSARQLITSAMTLSISWITRASPVLELCVTVGGSFGMASSSSMKVAGDSDGILSGVFDITVTDEEVGSRIIDTSLLSNLW